MTHRLIAVTQGEAICSVRFLCVLHLWEQSKKRKSEGFPQNQLKGWLKLVHAARSQEELRTQSQRNASHEEDKLATTKMKPGR